MIKLKNIACVSILICSVFSSVYSFGQSQSSSSSSLSSSSSSSSLGICGMNSSSSSSAPSSQLQCTITSSDSWGQDYQMMVNVTNAGDTAINAWDVQLDLAAGHSISSGWDVVLDQNGQSVQASNVNWNGNLQPGQSTSFGVQGAHPGTFITPVCNVGAGSNQPPVVDFNVDIYGPTVFVDASASSDPNGDALKYTIDFSDTKLINFNKAWHTYSKLKNYTVTVTATDGEHTTSSSKVISITEQATGNRAPIAMLAMDSSNGSVGASPAASFDEDGDPIQFQWNTIISPSGVTSCNVLKVLTVFDGELGDTIQDSVMAGPNVYHHNTAYARIAHRIEGNTIYVDGRDTSNASGVTWHFGDGVTSTALVTSHTYAEPGQYELTLFAHATPRPGNTSLIVNVGDGINNPPRATLDRMLCYENMIAEGNNVTRCFADSIYDPDGDDLTFTWNMGDGTTQTTAVAFVEHRYQTPGPYTVNVTASDGSASVQHVGFLTSKGNYVQTNTPPEACFRIVQNAIFPPPMYATFDANCATDADGDSLTYSWEFSDGTTAVGLRNVHTFATPGIHSATLTVSDGTTTSSATESAQFGPTIRPSAVCKYEVTSEWATGFSGKVSVTNASNHPIQGWSVNWNYAGDNRISSAWNATLTGSNPYTASNLSWNGTIQAGAKVEIGFTGSKTGAIETPAVTGAICQSAN